MQVKLRLVGLTLEPPAGMGWPEKDIATGRVEITWENHPPIALSVIVEGYRDLNDAAEQVRRRMEDFARDLLAAAANPLLGAAPTPPAPGARPGR